MTVTLSLHCNLGPNYFELLVSAEKIADLLFFHLKRKAFKSKYYSVSIFHLKIKGNGPCSC